MTNVVLRCLRIILRRKKIHTLSSVLKCIIKQETAYSVTILCPNLVYFETNFSSFCYLVKLPVSLPEILAGKYQPTKMKMVNLS